MKAIRWTGIFAGCALAGCTFPSSSTVYDRSQVGRTMHVETGDVIGVKDVAIAGQSGPIGVTGGGLIGYAAGSTVGKGAGSAIAGAVGAVGGAIAGSAVEEVATRKPAQQLTVKLGDGTVISVVQEIKNGAFFAGEHVQVMSGGSGTILEHTY